jgi:hypothetical protein
MSAAANTDTSWFQKLGISVSTEEVVNNFPERILGMSRLSFCWFNFRICSSDIM